MKTATIDYETYPIEKRPDYPPKPVGVSITYSNNKTEYLAFGHPADNTHSLAQVKRILKQVYSENTIICHHAKFDLEVGEKFFGLPLEPKHGFHCTMIQAFLYNPRSWTLKLKERARIDLGIEPMDETKLRQWVFNNVASAKKSKTKWGKYIYLAPVNLVAKYAKSDTKMTKGLFKKYMPYITSNNMTEQYEIEKKCMIESIYMERIGIKIDLKALKPALNSSQKTLEKASNAIYKVLGHINLNSPLQKINAFEKLGLVNEWELTDKGNPKTSIESLMKVCTNKKLVNNLEIYSKYSKLINTYMIPWAKSAQENNSLYYPWINTLKGDNDKGTYTGRFSSNFQQVPKKPNDVFKGMPFLRSFIMPDKVNHLLFNRDFCGQEIRILAHFTDGKLMYAFNDNPSLDGHNFVLDLMFNATGTSYPRDYIKACNFLMVYGGGAPALSIKLGVTLEAARAVLYAHSEALPEVGIIKKELKLMSRRNENFYTAGNRAYDFEPGKDYVALNTLIQGSAADHTKRAMLNVINMIKVKGYDARLILQIHDELMISSLGKNSNSFMRDFKKYMEKDKLFDVPMLTDGKVGKRWGLMKKFSDSAK